jgi:hypothetical protein
MAKKKKRRMKRKTLGEFGPPGEIKYRPPAAENKRSALERASPAKTSRGTDTA